MAATSKNRMLAVGTALGGDVLLLRHFSYSDQLGRLFQMELELESDNPELDFNTIVGTNATVRVQLPGSKTRFFNGYVSRFVQTGHTKTLGKYRATLVPWLWFLTRTADCRIFQKKKVPDIIEEVFKAHGFKDYKLKLSGTYPEWEYCVQYRETDFNFVSRMMEQEGIYYYFDHKDGVNELVLCDSPSAHEAFPGYAEMIFREPTHDQSEVGEFVQEWTVEKEVQPGLYTLADFNFKTPKAPILSNANKSRSHEQSGFEIFDYPGEFDVRDEGTQYAKIRMQELQSQHEIVRGRGTTRGVATGAKFKFKAEEHPWKGQDREYVVSSVSIQADAGEYASGGAGAGEFFNCSFSVVEATEQFRAARLTPKPIVQGPQTAIIVGKSGEEIDTDEFGRVKVQFHWDRYGKADENSSCWVRVSQPSAGKEWGAISLPRIGQEVIVEFLEGDPDLPIITGRVYNATNTVPYPLPDKKTVSTTKTNSSKGGGGFNEIRIEDKKGEEQVFIHAEKDFELRVKNDHFETTMHDHHLIVEHDQLIEIRGNRNETVAKDHCEEITGDRNLTVKAKQNTAITGDVWLKVDGKVEDTIGGDHTEKTTGNYKLKAAQITLEADSKIEIKVGGSKITMDPGKIEIKSPMITIKGDAQVEVSGAMTKVEGSGMLTLKGGMVMIN